MPNYEFREQHNMNQTIIDQIRDFKKGDAKAFERLFEIYHKRLYGFILKLTRSKADSEEIVQDAFMKVWINRANFNESYPFDAYLFKIAKNSFISHTRRQINKRIFEDHLSLFTEQANESADEQIIFKETALIVDSLINSMPPKRKEIFYLQKKEGLSRKEISERLNVSLVTIDSHLMKANKQFAEGLKKYGLLTIILFF